MIRIIPEPEEAGTRLDVFLAARVDGLSRSAATKLIESGHVKSSNRVLKKNHRVNEGQTIEVEMPEPVPLELRPQDIKLDIIYEDEDIIVINKAKGMVVHPAPGHPEGTLVNALIHHCGDRLSVIGGEMRRGIVHRLDKDTSGLMLAAKNDSAHMSLSSQLADRSLSRIYEAIVIGRMRDPEGTVNAPIGRSMTNRKKMAVTDKNSREAITHYEVIAQYRGYSHVRCILETGRTHQIRVHMAHIGHPVAGDPVYGRKKNELGLDSQCLHARAIKFLHPSSRISMEFTSELPEYFNRALNKLKLME
ncbi:MAG: RluA family pseudouridine synthase [Clostridiales bacterium]|jgi:23S rRNA pseudouridine1911/1915/1917 synthase|nr:RluA family pseudouridine synthase [Clostridiales bacterium]